MAYLSDQERRQIWKQLMEEASAIWEELPCPKQDFLDAIIATDTWIENNQASFNNALPACPKANLTQKQKLRLFKAVANKKYEVT